jgi:putative DNA primase/helicase
MGRSDHADRRDEKNRTPRTEHPASYRQDCNSLPQATRRDQDHDCLPSVPLMTAAQVMLDSMNQEGIHPAAEIIDDGVSRRIDDATGKTGNKLIFYVCFDNAGYFCHWSKMPEGKKIHVKGNTPLSDEERRDYAAKMQRAREARDKAVQERREECRERSAAKLSLATDADHPYLLKKGIQAHGMKVYKGRLTIPVYDTNDVLHGLQFIAADGTKRFEPGTATTGNFSYIVGNKELPLYLCEGFATAATVHEATGATVFICFSCGNLKAVALAIRLKIGPERIICICADNDRFTPGNPGLTHATAAATAIGGFLAVPTFPGDEGTDYNDLMQIVGDVLGGEKC